MSEGFNKGILSRLDPEHAATCVHCGIAFCTPCDVRDKKRAFPLLCENNPGRKEGETRAARPSILESRKATQVGNCPFLWLNGGLQEGWFNI